MSSTLLLDKGIDEAPRRTSVRCGVVVTAAGSFALTAGSASAAGQEAHEPLAVSVGTWLKSVEALLDYWTRERMRAALHQYQQRTEATNDAAAGPAVDAVGKVFFNHPNGTPEVCSGAATETPASTLVMTAGHCLHEGPGDDWTTNVVFVPGYENGGAPLGVFPAWNFSTDAPWSAEGDVAHDHGVIITCGNAAGERVVDVAGGFGVGVNQGAINDVTVFRCPAEPPYDGEHQEECRHISELASPPQNVSVAGRSLRSVRWGGGTVTLRSLCSLREPYSMIDDHEGGRE